MAAGLGLVRRQFGVLESVVNRARQRQLSPAHAVGATGAFAWSSRCKSTCCRASCSSTAATDTRQIHGNAKPGRWLIAKTGSTKNTARSAEAVRDGHVLP